MTGLHVEPLADITVAGVEAGDSWEAISHQAARARAGDVGMAEWVFGLSSEQFDTMEDLAMAEADALVQLLDEDGDDEEHTVAKAIAESREVLAGVEAMLLMAGRGGRLGTYLLSIDHSEPARDFVYAPMYIRRGRFTDGDWW
jgi:hypothetical protein